jgi:mannose-1-phosphate guanylyltransferase
MARSFDDPITRSPDGLMARSPDSVFDHAYAVILAGGSGTRFWPASRRRRPKQLLEGLFGGTTLLEQTAERIRPLFPPERTYIFTGKEVEHEVRRRLPEVPAHQVVAEPAARNTAPSLGLAAHEILRRDAQGVIVVLPSDHLIAKPASFRRAIRAACRWAWVRGRSVLIGIKPTTAHTGYGYIHQGPRCTRLQGQDIFKATRFTEKPSAEQARHYVDSGQYLWNGGMFAWQAATLLDNLARFKPEMARALERIAEAGGARARGALERIYPRLEKISVDYAVLQRAKEVYVVAADLGWNDVGSWSEVYELRPKDAQGNVRPRRSLAFDSKNNLILAGKFVAAVGVRDLVIVETPDAFLVARREEAQKVGQAVAELERQGWRELL